MDESAPSFEDYLESLKQLRAHVDPTMETEETLRIMQAARAISAVDPLNRETLASLVKEHPDWVPILGLVVGLTRESLKNSLKHHLGTSGWITLARNNAPRLIEVLDEEYNLVSLTKQQSNKAYEFGDVLVARAGSRRTAVGAGQTGRLVEDEIESVVQSLGLSYAIRTRFVGRGSSAPCDIAIPKGGKSALIVVAAKGFDSTGSKLTDAVREIEQMAEVRTPRQFTFAVIDGIGWKNRANDLRRIHELRVQSKIDGLYTLSMLDRFREAVVIAGQRLGLLESS